MDLARHRRPIVARRAIRGRCLGARGLLVSLESTGALDPRARDRARRLGGARSTRRRQRRRSGGDRRHAAGRRGARLGELAGHGRPSRARGGARVALRTSHRRRRVARRVRLRLLGLRRLRARTRGAEGACRRDRRDARAAARQRLLRVHRAAARAVAPDRSRHRARPRRRHRVARAAGETLAQHRARDDRREQPGTGCARRRIRGVG